MPLTSATTFANTRRSKCKWCPRREMTAKARSLNETNSITFPSSPSKMAHSARPTHSQAATSRTPWSLRCLTRSMDSSHAPHANRCPKNSKRWSPSPMIRRKNMVSSSMVRAVCPALRAGTSSASSPALVAKDTTPIFLTASSSLDDRLACHSRYSVPRGSNWATISSSLTTPLLTNRAAALWNPSGTVSPPASLNLRNSSDLWTPNALIKSTKASFSGRAANTSRMMPETRFGSRSKYPMSDLISVRIPSRLAFDTLASPD